MQGGDGEGRKKTLEFYGLGGMEQRAVLGWAPSTGPELAFMPCVEGLLVERE